MRAKLPVLSTWVCCFVVIAVIHFFPFSPHPKGCSSAPAWLAHLCHLRAHPAPLSSSPRGWASLQSQGREYISGPHAALSAQVPAVLWLLSLGQLPLASGRPWGPAPRLTHTPRCLPWGGVTGHCPDTPCKASLCASRPSMLNRGALQVPRRGAVGMPRGKVSPHGEASSRAQGRVAE